MNTNSLLVQYFKYNEDDQILHMIFHCENPIYKSDNKNR